MAIFRRALLSVAFASPAIAAPADASRAERSLGSAKARLTAIECFSLTCPHCAALRACEALPEIKAKWIAPGKLRWVFYDFPTDKAALQAAMVARYLPAERYERFINTLFENQDRWVFGAGSVADALWPLANDAGMDRTAFDQAPWRHGAAGLDRRTGAGRRIALARGRHTQLPDPRQALYGGDVRQRICYNSGELAEDLHCPCSFAACASPGSRALPNRSAWRSIRASPASSGPNGCGKSNVVEALRWAMGEQSTRSLRAGEMDDVIFAGTAGRPSRNLAEVTLTLDDTAGAVPPPFHEQAELEIIRRIERGSGSEYRVNGKEVRARDVQTLFADLATGAHASGMVSQGRVGALVTAKPEDRRAVLEEAAGITGLHARRHEAELKLRAAETNLARADDLRGQLEVQLGALKRQARQASRYRNISGAIRQAEAELLAIQRARAEAVRAEAEAALHAARMAVATATEAATQAATQAAEAAAALPPLRAAESDARTALERHRVAQEQIAAEEERARAALADASRRLGQLGQDLVHAEQLRHDSEAAESRLAAEDAALAEADGGPRSARGGSRDCGCRSDGGGSGGGGGGQPGDGGSAAEANARAQTVARQLGEAEQRWRRLDEQFRQVCAERDRIGAQAVDPAALAAACAEQAAAETTLASAREALAAAEQARATTGPALAAARERQAAADTAHAKLAAEANAIAEVLAVKDGERWPPMVDALGVPAGLETALGAALGEELTSAADRDAARHWRELPPFDPAPKLPRRVTPLAALVQAPPALGGCFRRSGWWTRTPSVRECRRDWRQVRSWCRAKGPSGAGTATRSAPARRPRRRSGCSSATGSRCCNGSWRRHAMKRRPRTRRTPLPARPIARPWLPRSRPATVGPAPNNTWNRHARRTSSSALRRPRSPRGSPPWTPGSST